MGGLFRGAEHFNGIQMAEASTNTQGGWNVLALSDKTTRRANFRQICLIMAIHNV